MSFSESEISGVEAGVLSFVGVGDDITEELILSLDCRVEGVFLVGKLSVFVQRVKLLTIFTRDKLLWHSILVIFSG